MLVRVTSTYLIHLERNRYGVPTEYANSAASARLHHNRIEVVADGVRVANHARSFDRSQTFYEHVLNVLARLNSKADQARLSDALASELTQGWRLQLREEPLANVDRYDDLRGTLHPPASAR